MHSFILILVTLHNFYLLYDLHVWGQCIRFNQMTSWYILAILSLHWDHYIPKGMLSVRKGSIPLFLNISLPWCDLPVSWVCWSLLSWNPFSSALLSSLLSFKRIMDTFISCSHKFSFTLMFSSTSYLAQSCYSNLCTVASSTSLLSVSRLTLYINIYLFIYLVSYCKLL